MKIMYTRPDDGGVSIVVAAPKEAIEHIVGPLTQEQYEAHIMARSVPADAINVKLITEENLPATREFRNAWVDVTPDNNINIDVGRAKQIKLDELRRARNEQLAATDIELTRALETNDAIALDAVKAKRQALRDVTEPLKAVDGTGIDDLTKLDLIRQLAVLPEV